MVDKKKEILMGAMNMFFGIAYVSASYLMLGKPLCGGGNIGVGFALPIGIGGVLFIMLGLYLIFREDKNEK